MSSIIDASRPASLSRALKGFWLSDGLRLLHACKTALAVAIGLGVCMRLELGSPRTTMVSVVIVMMHQQAGMTIARSLFRFVGIAAGSIVSLLMVGFLSQTFAAFYFTLACWTAGCVWGAHFHRNYQSYAFVLAGYAAAIVAVPAWTNPYGIVDSVIFTLSDVLIAIVTASLVNTLVFPQRLRTALFATGQRHCSHLIQALRTTLAATETQANLDALHIRLTGEHVAMEALRSAAVFEDPELRQRLGTLQGITAEFLDVTTAFHAVRRVLQAADTPRFVEAKQSVKRLSDWVRASLPETDPEDTLSLQDIAQVEIALHERLDHIREVAHGFAPANTGPAAQLYRTFATLLNDALVDLSGYLRYFELARAPMRAPSIRHAMPPRETTMISTANRWAAGIAAARALVVVILIASLWYASGWDGGATAVTGAAITSALFSTFPNPWRSSSQIFLGAVLGGFVAALFSFAVLPHIHGFPMLALAVAPVVMLGSYLGNFPALGPFGVGFNIYFCYVANITNPATYDPPVLLDSAFAFCTGIGAAAVAFRLLAPTSGSLLAALYVRQMRSMVSQDACEAELDAGSLLRFEAGVRDFLVQAGASPAQDLPRQWGFVVLDVGGAVLKVRALTAVMVSPPEGWQEAMCLWRSAIGRLFARPSPAALVAALDACQTGLDVLDAPRFPATAQARDEARAWLHMVKLTLTGSNSPFHASSVPA